MSKLRLFIGLGSAILAASAVAVVLTTRAANQAQPPAPAKAIAPSAPPAAAPPGAPQVPEPSATIRDDPTIAPDPKQSADNNVSFPSDI